MQTRNKSYGNESKIYKNVGIDHDKVVIQSSSPNVSFIYPNPLQKCGEKTPSGRLDFIKFEKYVDSITKQGVQAKYVYSESMGAGLKLMNSLEC